LATAALAGGVIEYSPFTGTRSFTAGSVIVSMGAEPFVVDATPLAS